MTYLAAPEIEIDGVIIPQFSAMQIGMSVENHYNRVSLVGTFGHGDEALIKYIEPTLQGSRMGVNIKMGGIHLFTGWISEAEYGYTENNGTFNLELINFTELLNGHKENLEQQKDKSYKQIIDWLLSEYEYINVIYMCSGEENESVEKFDLGATETVISGIKRLIGRKSWSVYTDRFGSLIIRSWKVENNNGAELLQGYNIKTCKLNTNMTGLFKNYVVSASFDKNKKEKYPTFQSDDKVKVEDTIPFTKATSENSVIDKNSIHITKVSSSISQGEGDTIANNILNKALASRFVYKVSTQSFTDLRGNIFLPGDLCYMKSDLVNWDGILLIKNMQINYNFGRDGNTEYQSSLTLVNKDFYANNFSLAQLSKKNKKEKSNFPTFQESGN